MIKNAIDPNAIKALHQMKVETANELGIPNNLTNNNVTLSSGENIFWGGYVGGNMTRKLVEMGEKQLINKK
ncbi:alpha/beta-type small acid-soluble spore protein [Marinisporobacter balticus]|uniref:Small acid-soluble spore protein alpha/beta type n=1 Tax=Marinisporobacter balticus TaxID=2018667 RepID=A0A4R2KMM5_9FIRM|nr:alpha/beta-type small acid-soluble spore protein [Marinisporobacter balticus]TCO74953.1 small acid-soluble spore protein alpha/beta type [Marinisporobacter balticus]